MGIFYNPLDGPLTGRKVAGIIVYCVLAAISIWATSESINSSFDVPIFIAYLLGTAFVLTMALLLSVIKQTFEDGRVSIFKLIFVIGTFLILWGVSLTTNTHKLFTQLKLSDIRKHELDRATIELANIGNNSLSIGNQVIDDYVHFVTSRIQDYKKEVRNPQNCGHGSVADTLMSKVQRSMPGSIFTVPSGRKKSEASCRQLANEMADLMTTELQTRTSSMKSKLTALSQCGKESKRVELVENLNLFNSFSTDFKSIPVKESISKAHEYYNQIYNCYNDGLIQSIGSATEFTNAREFKNNLELPVPSIDLEKISALIPFVRKFPKSTPGAFLSSFFFSLAIAFILDLASFIILYNVILKND